MEFGRRIGLLRQEVAEDEVKNWEEAFLGKSIFSGDSFAVLLKLRHDPNKVLFATLDVDSTPMLEGVAIDIPLTDHTPEETLIQGAYETTFWGEVVREKYREYATSEFTRARLLAFLNRKNAEVTPDEMWNWYITNFKAELHGDYGSVYISSHGTKDSYNAKIVAKSGRKYMRENTVLSAIEFARATQTSIPHISVEPLHVDSYMEIVKSTLRFLPKDWE